MSDGQNVLLEEFCFKFTGYGSPEFPILFSEFIKKFSSSSRVIPKRLHSIEDRFMLEVMTPEQTARYVEISSPEFLAKVARFPVQQMTASPAPPRADLNLIG